MDKEYKTEYYKDPTPISVLVIGMFLLVFFLFIYFSKGKIQPITAVFISCFLSISFIIFLIQFRKKWVKDATLHFDESAFTIQVYKKGSGVMLQQLKFLWKDISAYKPYFDGKNNTCITLFLKNNKKKLLIFCDQKTYERAIKQDSVFRNFYSFVTQYNTEHEQDKIIPKISFFASDAGKYILYTEVALIIFALFLHIALRNFSHAYDLILAIGLIFPQLLIRSQNREMYNKISGLGTLE